MIRSGINPTLSVPAASFLVGEFPIDRGVVRPGKAHCYGSLCVRRVRSNLVVKKIGDRFDRVWFRYQRFDFPVIQISSGRDYLSLHVPEIGKIRQVSIRQGGPSILRTRIPSVFHVQGDGLSFTFAITLSDKVECSIDPGGKPGGGDDLAVVDVSLVVDYLGLRRNLLELVDR